MVAALAVYFFMVWFQDVTVAHYYRSEKAVKGNLDDAFKDLNGYVNAHSVKANDAEPLQKWVRDNSYTILTIYDNQNIVFDGGWAYSGVLTQPDPGTEGGDTVPPGKKTNTDNAPKEERITTADFKEDIHNRIVEFADGPYYVYIDVQKENGFYNLMFFVIVLLCLTTFMSVVLVYNSKVINRMIRLSREVQHVSSGNLQAEIDPLSNDEIGRLAVNVDNMRNAIVERLQSEKKAWDSNTELITAMSHDIRTPLTSLIGYLDIIQSGKYGEGDEWKRYIDSSKEKALQLKDLSDKLFQYFLVFGSNSARNFNPEVFDGTILIQQLISEHAAELINYGYKIDFDYNVQPFNIKADLSALRRLFDNVFSNITKYADAAWHVAVSAMIAGDRLVITMINKILTSSRKVESNRIGLKTCEKICNDMGGQFSYTDDGSLFTVKIILPTTQEQAEPPEEEREQKGEREEEMTDDGNDKIQT